MGIELLALLGIGKQIVGWVTTQAALMNAEGAISDEEFNKIKAEAGLSDAAWDEAVAEARARLGR